MKVRQLAYLAVVVSAAPVVGAHSARADCVAASVFVMREQQSNLNVVGPNACLVPTPWNTSFHDGERVGSPGVLPAGTPDGVGVDVWVPAP